MESKVYLFISGVSISIRCDSAQQVYADGKKMLECRDIYQVNILPRITRVVAIRGFNGGGDAYIAAGFSNGFKTLSNNNKWRCTDQEHDGWRDVDFDDTEWPQATDYGADNQIKFVTDGISARKIWIQNIRSSSFIYCRGHIGE